MIKQYFNFIELPQFTKTWIESGLTDDTLRELQRQLLEDPEAGPIMVGTGGIRKLRFPLPGRGKSSSLRICYVFFHEYETIYLLTAYKKKDQDNLTEDQKQILKKLVKHLQEEAKRTRRYRI